LNGKTWILIGGFSAALAVALGAIGAHGLENWLEGAFPADMAKRLENWKTAANYQMYHALGMIAVGLVMAIFERSKSFAAAGWLMLVGTILFSGMLYGWVLTNNRTMVMIVPVGGLAFIGGWMLLAVGCLRSQGLPSSSRIDLG
jgi:uncharacterized membrane protein YgdD (TMEM256/DUF423 family)